MNEVRDFTVWQILCLVQIGCIYWYPEIKEKVIITIASLEVFLPETEINIGDCRFFTRSLDITS